MFNVLDKFGMPIKFGVIGLLGCPFGMLLANIIGLSNGGSSYLMAAISGGIGGSIGGWLRQRKG